MVHFEHPRDRLHIGLVAVAIGRVSLFLDDVSTSGEALDGVQSLDALTREPPADDETNAPSNDAQLEKAKGTRCIGEIKLVQTEWSKQQLDNDGLDHDMVSTQWEHIGQ